MSKLVLSFFLFFLSVSAMAQSGTKVKWEFSSKKIADKKYEIKMVANIQPGWHLYSQNQSEDAIALPTTIKFVNNPLVVLSGKPQEVGRLYDQYEKATRSRSRFYSNKVEFIQTITLKNNVKTAVAGEIEFMVCDDKQCLPPDVAKFSIKL
ncbi:MAG TPA: protein-disulfide reductase DsbD domain-containing protein [Lacibacter sp.]|nr:protein-disulfide reductase DsbD domain-containing protein [Lacibacter sp.]